MAKGISGRESHPGENGMASDLSRIEYGVDENGLRLRVFESEALFGQEREIIIRHTGHYYRLRITRQGKLILNK